MSRWRSDPLAFAFVVAAAALLASACAGSGLSRDQAKAFVALSLASDAELHLASFTGSFCESDDGRRMRSQPNAAVAVPSNAYAFGRMADNAVMKKLVAAGYVDLKEETFAPDSGEARHPACGKRDICLACPVISKYCVATYQLTPKGEGLFLVTPVTEDDFTNLYNTGAPAGPFDDVQQAFGDDMPLRISIVVATKVFEVTSVATDSVEKTASVNFDWHWKPASRIDKTMMLPLIPQGRNHATVQLKLFDDGWHLERDAPPVE